MKNIDIKESHQVVKPYWIGILLLVSINVFAAESDYFVTTWAATGPSNTVTIPTAPGSTYNYAVDWDNDGVFDEFNITGDATHDYAGGLTVKTIRIAGTFPRILINYGANRSNILSIEQWGTNPWTSMRNAFYGADNLVNNASDTPDLSGVDSLHQMFRSTSKIGTGTGVWNWNTTGITDMSGMFQSTQFNNYIGSWDTSSVTTFNKMFYGAILYDKNINNWNVEAATDFTDMFLAVTLSTSNYEGLLISWAAQNINNALSLTLNFSKYCSQEARTARNSLIFSDGLSITDAGLCDEGYFITTWKTDNPGTSNSTSITIPTEGSETYNYQVDWNGDGDFNDADENINYTANATHDYGTAGTYTVKIKGIFPRIYFNDGGDKDKILSIEQWGTKTWSSMQSAFMGTHFLKMNAQDTPDLSETSNLVLMFTFASELGLSTGNWEWDTTNVINMASAFLASGFDFDISSWNVQNVASFASTFNGSSLSSENYDKILSTWWTQSLKSNVIFGANITQFCSQAAQDGRAYIIADYNWTFTDAGLDPDCDTSIIENHFVITVDTENTGTSGPNSFLIPTTGSGYNYSIDGNNDGTFEFTGITGPWMINFGAAGIKTIGIAGDFPRIYFNESGDKDKILSVEQWGTNRWTSMNNAFSGASNLVINATDTPDLSNVTSLFKMFLGASNLGNGSGNWNWDTSTISGMSQLFKDAVAFDEDISSWDIENVNNVGAMFAGATLSSPNYDALLISWDTQLVNPSLIFNGGNSKYCSQAAQDAHERLIDNELWIITDGGIDPSCVIDDLIFMDGFESVVTLKTSLGKVAYDFSEIIATDVINDAPRLIISGIDSNAIENMQIHMRNDMGVLQIRISFRTNGTRGLGQWELGAWQNVTDPDLVTLQWNQ